MTSYEVMLVPFDRVDINAVFQSEEHLLREGEILGFNVEFNDFDVHSELLMLSGHFRANTIRIASPIASQI